MKKDFFKKAPFLLLFLFVLLSCNNDERNNVESLENNQLLQKNSGKVHTGFEDLFNEIYEGNYQVGTPKIHENSYLVTEIIVNSAVKGYFVKDTRNKNVVYYDHNAVNGILNEYKIIDKKFIKNTYDLTEDSEYNENGFSPNNTQLAGRRPFWGYGNPYLSDECINGRRYWYVKHYAFWIGFSSPEPVNDSNGNHLWAPCE